jgi:AsmA protein
MRKLLIALGAVVLIVVLALAVLPRFVDINSYHDRIQAELTSKLGRQVTLGQMSLTLFPPKFTVDDATIAEDPTFQSGRPFAKLKSIDIRVKLLPLLSKRVEVNSVRLQNPQIEMVKNRQGVWNFSTIGQKNQPSESGGSQNMEVGELMITDGSVAITDLQKAQPRTVYDHIDVDLTDYAKGKPFGLDLAVHLPGPGNQVAKLSGKGGPINDADTLATPFNGRLELNEVSLHGVKQFLNNPELEGNDATISGKADLTSQSGKLTTRGTLQLKDAVIRNNKIGYPIAVDYDLAHDLAQDVLQLNKADVKLGNTPVSISGSLNMKSDPSLANLRIQANEVSIAEVARLAAAFGVAMNPGMDVAGRLNLNMQVQGATNSPSLNGTATARDVSITGKSVPAPVKVPAIDLTFTPEQIRSNDFTASTGGTNVAVRFAMSQYTTPSPTVDAAIRTQNANVGELLNIAEAAGVTAADGMSGSGVASLDVHAVGPIKNTEAMQFNGSGTLQNAVIKTPELTQPINVKNANLRFTQNSAVLDGVQMSLASMNASGNATVRNFNAPQVQFALSADKVNATELQKLIAPTPATTPQPVKAAAPTEPSIITKMTGSGTISAGLLQYDTMALQNVRATVNLNHGVITLNPVTAQSYGGTSAGSITVDTRAATTQYNVALKTQQVDANQLLSSMSNTKNVLFGLLASNIQGAFVTGPVSEDVAKTLNGRVSLNLTDGKLANVDLLNQLAAIGKFQSLGRTAQDFTKLQQLTGDLDIRNGVATTNNLKAIIEGGTLAGAGTLSLVDQSVNMHMTAVLNKNYSQTVGGAGVGGYMQTALANKNGELVLPVLVSGTMQKMRFTPDVEALAKMKMQNILPSLQNPGQLMGGKGGAWGGLLNALGGKQQPPQQTQQQSQQQPASGNAQQQQQQQPQNTVQQIIDIFGNKKKKQQ